MVRSGFNRPRLLLITAAITIGVLAFQFANVSSVQASPGVEVEDLADTEVSDLNDAMEGENSSSGVGSGDTATSDLEEAAEAGSSDSGSADSR